MNDEDDDEQEVRDEEVNRNVYYSRRGWSPPDIPIAYQISRQDLVILMTVCSQVRFLVTGQSRNYGNLGPTDVASALAQDILDIEHTVMQGTSREPSPGSMASVPKVIIKKKGAHSPIEEAKVPKEEDNPPLEMEKAEMENQDNEGSCAIY